MRTIISTAAFLFLLPVMSLAQSVTVYEFDGDFEDATFGVESGIIDRGLVIDWTSKVGDMLNRTGADVGSSKKIFENADVFQFCSAALSRKMMEADPLNIGFCPYGIFVAEPADGSGKILVGYRNLPEGIMQEVQSLLDEIAREVVDQ
jgi:uncharacterized protein (DUF302 family)